MDNKQILIELKNQVYGLSLLEKLQFWTVYIEIAARTISLKIMGSCIPNLRANNLIQDITDGIDISTRDENWLKGLARKDTEVSLQLAHARKCNREENDFSHTYQFFKTNV